MPFIENANFNGLRTASWRAALLIATCLFAVASQSARAATISSAALRGQNWDAIKRLPDWSGMWTPGPPPAGTAATLEPGAIFGAGVPLTAQYAAERDARIAAVRGDKGADKIPLSNSGLCLPNGTPANMGPVSHEYLFTPGRVTILLENSEIRRIYTDGRMHVPDDQVNPSYSGDSIGHWQGNTLVVDTTNIFPEAELYIGRRVTEQTHVSERITRVGNKLRIDTMVEDSELFTKPWTYTRWYDHEDRAAVDYESCTESDRTKTGGERLLDINFDVSKSPVEEKKSGEKK